MDVLRARLGNLGWFMQALKEPLATCAYIDVDPVAADLAATPETNRHTSVYQRVEHAAAQRRLEDLKAAACGSVAGSRAAGAVKEDLWLCPIEDRRRVGWQFEGFSLGSYLLLVDYTSRLCRQGKANRQRRHLDGLRPGDDSFFDPSLAARTGSGLGVFHPSSYSAIVRTC